MSNEIEYNVNSGEVSKELASIQAAVNQTTKVNVSACAQSLAAVTQLSNAVSVLKNNYSALNLTAAATVTTLAATNAMMVTSMAQVTDITASIMVMNTSLLQGVVLWNMLTAAVLLNTTMMAQNMMQIANSLAMMDQFTVSITANTAALLSNMTQTLLNTLASGLNKQTGRDLLAIFAGGENLTFFAKYFDVALGTNVIRQFRRGDITYEFNNIVETMENGVLQTHIFHVGF